MTCVLVADYGKKSPSAIDYSDIQETAEDESSQVEDKTLASSLAEQKQGMHRSTHVLTSLVCTLTLSAESQFRIEQCQRFFVLVFKSIFFYFDKV